MNHSLRRLSYLTTLVAALWGAQASASPGVKKFEAPCAKSIPLDELPQREREMVSSVVDKASLAARSPAEAFHGDLRHYRYFLDHPHHAVSAWRRLGAKCVSITPCDGGGFGWNDDQGSELVWEAVHCADGLRIWHAEGKVKPGPLLPAVPVKAVVVLRYSQKRAADGAALIHHQADLFVQTDSKTANLMARMMGPAANRIAEQGLGQLQLFFSGLCWFLDRHPEQARKLLPVGKD